ncbi:hypothetical protein DN752_17910 [Echinicola strongylocentroti]|uniref:Uncharacterized protein n=1 Tax=Echinicola strongylocentroti TaxID=1795355 RepID=A0A2Z4IMN3_9BACT|nr:hypothetical protein [Echinicola strongylocentroti]AWW31856.1 hypothetical protein DN752_17910 [Echinicola strongylocentroti]
MTLADLFKEIWEAGKTRIKTPIIGAFIISWMVFNWKPVMIILFEQDLMSCRIEIVKDNYSSICSNLVYPLISAFIAVIAVQYFSIALNFLLTHAKGVRDGEMKKKALDKLRIDSDILTERERLSKLRSSVLKEESEENEIIQLREQANELRKQNMSLQNSLTETQNEITNLTNRISLDYKLSKTHRSEDFITIANSIYNEIKNRGELDHIQRLSHAYRLDPNDLGSINLETADYLIGKKILTHVKAKKEEAFLITDLGYEILNLYFSDYDDDPNQ